MSSNVKEMREEVRALKKDIRETISEFRDFERVTFRTLSLVRRFTGEENIDSAINKMMRAISIMRQVQITVQLTMAATGPIGWAMLAVSATAVAFSATDFMTTLGD